LDKPRRLVAKIKHHPGRPFPRVGFIVTNLRRPSWQVVKFYNGGGTAEQWIKNGKNPVKWTWLSCHDFVDNQVGLQLFVPAYKLAQLLAAVGSAPRRQALVPDGAAGKPHHDRGQGGVRRSLRGVLV
jgi:hypothetical protein